MLSINLLHRISNPNYSRDRAGNLTPNVEQGAIRINFDHYLIQWGCRLATHVASHFLSLENLTRELTHTNRTSGSVSLGHTVRRILHSETPSFNSSLKAFTFAGWDRVDKLSNFEVARSKAVTDWQEVFFWNFEFSNMSLRGKIIFQKMSNLGLVHFLRKYFANSDLNRVNSIPLLSLNLCYLASIKLNNGTWLEFTPFVPEMGHSNLVAQHTRSGWVSVNLLGRHDWELLVDIIFEWAPGLDIICDTELTWANNLLVVEATLWR